MFRYKEQSSRLYKKVQDILFTQYNNQPCSFCGKKMYKAEKSRNLRMSIDHIIPKKITKQMYDMNNLQVLHYICNIKKGH